jgi:hypothetical protein
MLGWPLEAWIEWLQSLHPATALCLRQRPSSVMLYHGDPIIDGCMASDYIDGVAICILDLRRAKSHEAI